jgi:Carboxypeptidase regulatory-like domain
MRHQQISLRIILLAAVFCLGLSGLALGQEITGSIVGSVKDSSGAAVKGATVTITDAAKKIAVRTLSTNDDGEFSAALVPVAYYDITVEAAGFKKHVDTQVKVNVNDRRTVDVTLEAGNIAEIITVTSDPLQVNTQSAAAANVINGEQVRQLSLNNRNFVQLITLSPGVSANIADQIYVGTTNPGGASNALQIAVNGVRSSSNTYNVDGADTTDRGANLTIQTYPSVDAIAEFTVLRSLYPAESGRSSGGQVNVVTKSGSDSYHGDVYEFFRNDWLNANSFLTNRTFPLGRTPDGKAKRVPLRYNNFGGTFGGPVISPHFGEGGPMTSKLKETFFFFSEEFRRVITYPTFNSTVPTAGLRQGIFPQDVCIGPVASPCSTILPAGQTLPQNLRSRVASAYVQDIYNKLPLPSDAAGTLFFPARGIFNFRQELIRIDHRFNDKLSAYYRFENDTIPTIEPIGLFSGGAGQPGVSTTQSSSPGRTHVGRVTWVKSPTTVWEFGGSYSFGDVPSKVIGLLNNSNSPDVAGSLPTFPFTVTRGRVPTIAGNGFSGLSTFGPYSDFSYNKTFNTTLSKVFGTHTTKYGFYYSKIRKHENSLGGTNEGTYGAVSAAPTRPTTQIGGPPGNTTATSATNQLWANFLVGNFQTFTQNQFDLTADLHSSSVEAFAQDEWRYKSNITLYYGVRFSRFGQPWDGNGRLTSFDPARFDPSQAFQVLANGVRVAGTGNVMDGIIVNSQVTVPGATVSPFGKAVAPTRNNFAPRVGIAWDPFKKGTTSVRAGYGVYFDQLSFSFPETGLVGTNPPFQALASLNPVTLDNPLAGNPVVSLTVPTVAGIDQNFKTPYVQSWSLDVQHQLDSKTLITVGYFGSRGTHLSGLIDANLLPPNFAIGQTCRTNNVLPATFGPCQVAGTQFTSSAAELILNQIRPFRGYGPVRLLQTRFNSNYHSLQISGQRRFGQNSQLNVAYTWAKNLTNSQNESATAPQNTYQLHDEYAPANLDRRHVLSVNYIYELPFFRNESNLSGKVLGGWQISGITSYFTGLPFTATTANIDAPGLGLLGASPSGFRPDVTCDPNSGGAGTFAQFFNTACFANVPAGVNRVGNEARGVIKGPSTTRFDATLAKSFKFNERTSMQLRWEVFNIFNHTNFTTVALAVSTPATFGTVTGVRDPRTMQLAMKILF